MQRWSFARIRSRCGNVQEARVKSRSGRLVRVIKFFVCFFVALHLLYFETPIWSHGAHTTMARLVIVIHNSGYLPPCTYTPSFTTHLSMYVHFNYHLVILFVGVVVRVRACGRSSFATSILSDA